MISNYFPCFVYTNYFRYFGTLCLSTILQSHLLRIGLSKNIAFWSTIATGSIVNYFVLMTLDKRSKSALIAAKISSLPSKIENNIGGSTTFTNIANNARRRKSHKSQNAEMIAMIPTIQHAALRNKHCIGNNSSNIEDSVNKIHKIIDRLRYSRAMALDAASAILLQHQCNSQLKV